MPERWAIYIDIEGFSALYPECNDALFALTKLMLAIHRIGKSVFPETPDRLFAYQLGDGFLIVSEFHEVNLDRAVSIAISLMKFITPFGVFSRATIAEGDLSGITGCYSDEVMNECDMDGSTSRMGWGLMTIFPVMGAALINAVGIDKRSPKGPLLCMAASYKERLSDCIIHFDIPGTELIAIDWVHTDFDELTNIMEKAILKYPNPEELEILVKIYLSKHKLPEEWVSSCSKYLCVIDA